MNVEYFYYIFKLIRDGILNGFMIPYEFQFDRTDTIFHLAITAGLYVKIKLLRCGIIVMSRPSYRFHKKKFCLIDMEDPPDFLLGVIFGYPVKMLPHGSSKDRAICFIYEEEEGKRTVIHSIRCGDDELGRIQRESEIYLEFMNRYTRDTNGTFIVTIV